MWISVILVYIKMKTKKILFFLLVISAVLFFGTVLFFGNDARAQPSESPKCDPANFEELGGVCVPINTGLSPEEPGVILIAVLKWILYILGFLAVLAFIVSGLQYMLSGGDERQVETAKRNMKYSIIGLVIALSSLIILFVIDDLLNAFNPG